MAEVLQIWKEIRTRMRGNLCQNKDAAACRKTGGSKTPLRRRKIRQICGGHAGEMVGGCVKREICGCRARKQSRTNIPIFLLRKQRQILERSQTDCEKGVCRAGNLHHFNSEKKYGFNTFLGFVFHSSPSQMFLMQRPVDTAALILRDRSHSYSAGLSSSSSFI